MVVDIQAGLSGMINRFSNISNSVNIWFNHITYQAGLVSKKRDDEYKVAGYLKLSIPCCIVKRSISSKTL